MSKFDLTPKQSKLLFALRDQSNWKVSLGKIVKFSGYYDNKSCLRSLKYLLKIGVIDKDYRPIEPLSMDTTGTQVNTWLEESKHYRYYHLDSPQKKESGE